MRRPFEAGREELARDLNAFVDATYADLQSSLLVLPKGTAHVPYVRFQDAYEQLKQATGSFQDFRPETVWSALKRDSLVFLVLRTILGLTSPEWAGLAAASTGKPFDRNAVRSLDLKARTQPNFVARLNPSRQAQTLERLDALITAACTVLVADHASTAETVHRLDKIDTAEGLTSLRRVADFHVPYAVLLYERYLGRPFASHRDSVSERSGDVMENAIETILQDNHVSARKTRRAERLPNLD